MRYVNLIVVHCSATPPKMDIGAKEITEWHLERGWQDIGYHAVVRRDGTPEKGRDSGIPGAHARGYNNRSIGLCYVGGVNEDNVPEDNITKAQKTTLRHLINFYLWIFPDAKVVGHGDLPGVNKACPSFDVKRWYYEQAD